MIMNHALIPPFVTPPTRSIHRWARNVTMTDIEYGPTESFEQIQSLGRSILNTVPLDQGLRLCKPFPSQELCLVEQRFLKGEGGVFIGWRGRHSGGWKFFLPLTPRRTSVKLPATSGGVLLHMRRKRLNPTTHRLDKLLEFLQSRHTPATKFLIASILDTS
ncbi:unnamed protein product [Microthlaspi erraticum]|uniref:Uncharacterized protein n=1 Tax=Microthlaspi erraticum TaxID=1685480 RepID=A0A6D2IWJ6_9BRAS|nr:unnamed protein product [Microthlaspi erraticum]